MLRSVCNLAGLALSVAGVTWAAQALNAQEQKKEAVPEIMPRAVLYGDKHYPCRVAMTPDQRTIVSACAGFGGVRFWDVAGKKERVRGQGHDGRGVLALAISPDGKRAASGGFNDKRIIIWNIATGKPLAVLTGHQQRIIAVHFSPDGKKIISASVEGDIKVWDAIKGKQIGELFGKIRDLSKAELSSDGKTLARLPGARDAAVNLWDVAGDKETLALKGLNDLHGGSPAAFSPNGKWLAAASGGNRPRVMLWDIATGKQVKTIPLTTSNTHSLAFSPDSNLLATGHDAAAHIQLWDLNTGKAVATFVGHTGMIEALAFAPDGLTLISGARDQRIRLWDVPVRQRNER
ncbi:MAG: WD40 repeat domain-containing protein [Planctomycetes bacterium]|nr:WD40 repeat domain-containing protein [Planctomycetota bacterium]